MSENNKPVILLEETYKKMIDNAVGSGIFNTLYAIDSKEDKQDLLRNGEFSCAVFVSSILKLFDVLPKQRATVDSLYKDVIKSELFSEEKESALKPGDIIFWEKFQFKDGSKNRHVGFYVGNKESVSTSYKDRAVARHHYKNFSSGQRNIESVFRINWKKIQ